MKLTVYADHLQLETIEDLRNYLLLFNSNLVLHPTAHHKSLDLKGDLDQVDVPRALQQTGMHYTYDGHNYHVLGT